MPCPSFFTLTAQQLYQKLFELLGIKQDLALIISSIAKGSLLTHYLTHGRHCATLSAFKNIVE